MEGAAAGMAVIGVHGFPAVLTSLVGRAGAVREVAGLGWPMNKTAPRWYRLRRSA